MTWRRRLRRRWARECEMDLVSVYWSHGKRLVVIPTLAKTEAGFWLEGEPVAAVPILDSESIARAIMERVLAPSKLVPTPPARSRSKPAVLKPGRVRSWSQFHWNYSVLQIATDREGKFSVAVWEKHADGSYRPCAELPAVGAEYLDDAISTVIREIERPE